MSRRRFKIALVAAFFALTGCGDEEPIQDEAPTAEEPAPDEPAEQPDGPVGPLRVDGVGKLTFELATKAQARREFGPPDRVEEVSFAVGPAPRFDWLYEAEPDFRLVFDSATDKVVGYQCTLKCDLETKDGFAVGDSMAAVKQAYGDELEEYPIGVGALILPAGDDELSGGLIFTGGPKGGGDVIGISAFNTIAGPAGD